MMSRPLRTLRTLRSTAFAPLVAALCSAAIVFGAGAYRDARTGNTTDTTPVGDTAFPVVRVDAGRCGELRQGTATVVDVDGVPVVFTNEHVPKGASEVTVTQGAAEHASYSGGAVTLKGLDAARVFLDVDLPGAPPGPKVRYGDVVSIAGFEHGVYTTRTGRVDYLDVRRSSHGRASVMVLDVQVEPGMSGGAVLNSDGEVVGLIAARDSDTGAGVAYHIGDVLAAPLAPLAPMCEPG